MPRIRPLRGEGVEVAVRLKLPLSHQSHAPLRLFLSQEGDWRAPGILLRSPFGTPLLPGWDTEAGAGHRPPEATIECRQQASGPRALSADEVRPRSGCICNSGGKLSKKSPTLEALPAQARLVIPVLGPVGGSGRSTTAGLLAAALSSTGPSVVLDTAPRLASPWPLWCTEPGNGLLSIPPDRPATRRHIQRAAAGCRTPEGHTWQVLTDHQGWSSAPLSLPADPAAWHQLAAAGGWQAVIADTPHAMAQDIIAARCAGRSGQTASWCGLPFAVPVLSASATGPGVQALQVAVKAAVAEGLPLGRAVVALISTGEGRPPAPVRAAATMLRSHAFAVVSVPYDSHIRAHGMSDSHRVRPKTLTAGHELARAVLASARAAWGDPLPSARTPAPLSFDAVVAPEKVPA